MVTAAGAEALPFLASFCVLPASLLFFFAYGTQPSPHHRAVIPQHVQWSLRTDEFLLTDMHGSGRKTMVMRQRSLD